MINSEKDTKIIREIMANVIQSPEDEYFTQNLLYRLRDGLNTPETSKNPRISLTGIFTVFFIAIIFITSISFWIFEGMVERYDMQFIDIIQIYLEKLAETVYFSPLFLLMFVAFFLLYLLDSFLRNRIISDKDFL